MSRAFDTIPLQFTPETIDMVTQEYLRVQREENINLANPVYSDEFRIGIIQSQLEAIADFPDNVNSSYVIQLAVSVLAWIENLNG